MKQISIVVDEQPSFPLADITELMAANNINIDSIESETVRRRAHEQQC